MPTSLTTSLIVNRRLSKIIYFTASMFSSVVDVSERLGRAQSLTSSRFSLRRLYQNWFCVLLIVGSPNATVNISNIIAHLIQFFTKNLTQFLWSIFSNSKKSKNTTSLFIHQKQTENPKWLILSTLTRITDMCENRTYVTHEILKYRLFFDHSS